MFVIFFGVLFFCSLFWFGSFKSSNFFYFSVVFLLVFDYVGRL